ncbi:MAG: DUF4834 family protein [Candidatus Pseudobacter hemicellulosilyticus]|uniref:DUF4834 family protein n=1 Tax=Candidatus Pseudobacter hemicellulosilyticus TaxID=3121375 RepID=A0AAJ5WVS7_9BACT|nr:MAG: DUF4834 family protein [Pseudobacter sp.]
MTGFKLILWAVGIWFLYRFVVRFLIPVVRVGRQMRQQVKGFRDMMDQQQAQQQTQQGYQQSAASAQASQQPEPPKQKAGEYIDFEEVK